MIVCGRLLNIAVPGPLEQSLFRRSGVLNFNLSCNSLLEEVGDRINQLCQERRRSGKTEDSDIAPS